MNKTVHFFVDANSSCGYVSLLNSNLADCKMFRVLKGYPQEWVNRLYEAVLSRVSPEDGELHILHDCMTGRVSGVIIPKRQTGFINLPLYRDEDDSVAGLIWQEYLTEIKKNLTFAHEHFLAARGIHDEWEKVYINNTDFKALDDLTQRVIHSILGDCSLDKTAKTVHRFFGAATIEGSCDYITDITKDVGKRYFIKGRPGTGKSTFLKKVADAAQRRGINCEVYHCAFDPNSWDMVVLRELGLCLFDSTAPHEYFPERSSDEIIDVYKEAVVPGTDEQFKNQLSEFQKSYKNTVAQATSFLQLSQRIYDDLMLRVSLLIPQKQANEQIDRLCDELFVAS